MNNLNDNNIIVNEIEDNDDLEHIICNNGSEQAIFLMRDKDHEFTLGLTSVLECIGFAVKNGDLPKLPKDWCDKVEKELGVQFDEDVYS